MTSELPSHAERTARDHAWLARMRDDDEAAFEALYRAYYRVLMAIVLPVVPSGAIAEEIVEDIFVELWQQRRTLRVTHAVSAYLYGAARNRALNALRRDRVERRWHAAAAQDAKHLQGGTESDVALGALLDAPRIQDAVRHAVSTLSPRRQLVLHLRWERGMSYAEIAACVGSSVVAVERQLSRTLKALRVALPEWLGPER